MPLFGNALAGAAGSSGADAFTIQRSLRFNDNDSAYLNRVFSAGNRKTWTWSAWVKKSSNSAETPLFIAKGNGSPNPHNGIWFGSDRFSLSAYPYNFALTTDRLFRDPSAWYHFVVAFDTTESTASDRMKIWVNGERQTQFNGTVTYPNQNWEGLINSNGYLNQIGQWDPGYNRFFDGLMAEVHFVDGRALDATDFGEVDSTTGAWNPIKFTGSHNGPAVGLGGVTWSSYVSGPVNSTKPLSLCFGGTIGSGYQQGTTATGGNALTLNVSALNLSVTNVRLNTFIGGSPGTLTVNGSNVSYSGSGDQTQVVAVNGQLNTIVWGYDNGNNYVYMRGIEVDLGDGSGYRLLTDGAGTPAGSNGFHLDFSDNSSVAALGYDAAGSNNWTLNNIASPPAGNFDLSTASLNPSGGASYETGRGELSMAFDGDTESYLLLSNQNNHGVNFSPGISVSTKVEIYGKTASQYVTTNLNSSSVQYTANSWTTVYTGSGTLTSITMISNNNRPALSGIKVDGVELIANGLDTDSLLDSPTNYDDGTNIGGNYATWNPLDKGSTLTLANGNLQIVSITNDMVRSTIAMTSGKWYAEYTHGTSLGMIGIANANANNNLYLGQSAGGVGYYSAGTTYFNNNGGVSYGASYTTGDVIGVAFDADTGSLTFYKNGASQGVVSYTGMSSGPYFFACGVDGMANSHTNFGQRPFTHTPPTGFLPLVTTSLSDPLIADPSTAFDAKLFTGNGTSQTVSGYNFSPDLAWFKSRSGTDWHVVADTVRGKTKVLFPNATDDEEYRTEGISDFNSDGFSLGDYAPMNKNNDALVAWAWTAGTNSNKTYTVKVVSDSGNKYRFDGHGTSAVTLDLAEGSTYVFDQSDSSNAGHPIRFGTSANGTDYTTGVTHTGTPGQAGAKTTLVLGTGVSTLYYSCQNHSGMGGQINTNSTAGCTHLSGSQNATAYDQSQQWSNYLSASGGSGFANNGNGAFSGTRNFIDYTYVNGATSSTNYTMTFTPPSAISFTSSLRVQVEPSNGKVSIDGGTTYVNGGSTGLVTFNGPGSFTSIIVADTRNQWSGEFAWVEVDGKLLVNSNATPPNVPSINSVVKASPEAGAALLSTQEIIQPIRVLRMA